jgi:hypothetical protein
MTDLVRVTVDRGVATLCLDRSDNRNAVNHAMWTAIGSHCRELAHDPVVGVLVVRGSGDHFCAGADISGLSAADDSYRAANLEAEAALASFPRPPLPSYGERVAAAECRSPLRATFASPTPRPAWGSRPPGLGSSTRRPLWSGW